MKISPAGFPGLLLILLSGVGAYLLFGRQSFIMIGAGLIAGIIIAIFLSRHNRKPEQDPLFLTQSDDTLQRKQVSSDEDVVSNH